MRSRWHEEFVHDMLDVTPPPSAPSTARPASIVLLLLAAVALAYGNALRVPFVFDDYPAIVRNPTIRRLWPLTPVLNPPVTAAGAAGRPLVNVSLAFDHALSGDSPIGYHVTNLWLHAIAACLLFAVLHRTFSRARAAGRRAPLLAALAVSLIWAVHPLLSESVVCIIQRNEILVAIATLVTLYALLQASTSGRPRPWLALGVGTTFLGALSKEVAVVIPVLVLLFDRTLVAGSFARAWRARRGFYVGLLASWFVIAWLVLHNQERAGTAGFGLGVSPGTYALTQCRAILLYVKLVVWPQPLVVDYGLPVFHLSAAWPAMIAIIAALGATVRGLVRRRPLALAAAVFFILLAPSSSIVPLTTQTIAEHRMYLPSAAALVGVALLLHRLLGRRAAVIALGIAAAFAVVTAARVSTYRTELNLWSDTVAKVPENARAHASLAGAYAKQQNWTRARAEYHEAISLRPDYADAHNDFALVLSQIGDAAGALREAEAAARFKPADPDIQYNLANAFAKPGRDTDAVVHYRLALERRRGFPAAERNLADVLLRLGRGAEAIRYLDNALQATPDDFAARHSLAVALLQAGRREEAAEQFHIIVRQQNTAAAHNDLGLALAEAGHHREALKEFEISVRLQPDFAGAEINAANACLAIADQPRAAAHLQAAVRLVPQNAELRYNLGALLAALGRTEDARAEFEAALKLNPNLTAAREALRRLP